MKWYQTTKSRWSFISVAILIGLVCLGLLIWGAVVLGTINYQLDVNSIKASKVLGGLLVGIPTFILIIIVINLSYFIYYHYETKKELKDFLEKMFKRSL